MENTETTEINVLDELLSSFVDYLYFRASQTSNKKEEFEDYVKEIAFSLGTNVVGSLKILKGIDPEKAEILATIIVEQFLDQLHKDDITKEKLKIK